MVWLPLWKYETLSNHTDQSNLPLWNQPRPFIHSANYLKPITVMLFWTLWALVSCFYGPTGLFSSLFSVGEKKKSPTLRTISTVPKTAMIWLFLDLLLGIKHSNLLVTAVFWSRSRRWFTFILSIRVLNLCSAQLSFSNDRGVWCQISYYVQTYRVQDKYFYVRKHFVVKVKK